MSDPGERKTMRRLKTTVATYGHTKALKDGTVTSPLLTLDFVEYNPMMIAYRKMVRDLEFDVAEMAVTTYLVAKAHGKAFTALPIVLNHILHHGDIQTRLDAGIEAPADLAGKRVGVRAYTVTTGVWVRGLLSSEYGVAPSSITWITDDEEHVQEFRAPQNVIAAPDGKSIVDLFHDGAIDAAFGGAAGLGRSGPPRAGWDAGGAPQPSAPIAKSLFPDAAQRDIDWYNRTGIYPIHGVLVVKDSVLASDPAIAPELCRMFTEAKELFLQRLRSGASPEPDDARWQRFAAMVGGDPLPYGIEANRKTLEALIAFAYEQQLIPTRYRPEDVFAAC